MIKVVATVPTYGEVDGSLQEGVSIHLKSDGEMSNFVILETPETIYKVSADEMQDALERVRMDDIAL